MNCCEIEFHCTNYRGCRYKESIEADNHKCKYQELGIRDYFICTNRQAQLDRLDEVTKHYIV